MIQTATTIKQSKKLLSLGVDPKTADMTIICKLGKTTQYLIATPYGEKINYPHVAEEYFVPAWSLSALISLLPDTANDSVGDDINKYGGEWRAECGMELRSFRSDIFSSCIDLIERLVKHRENK